MSFDRGGGGGRAETGSTEDQLTFDQPYEIGTSFTQATADQINEMFRILFKALRRIVGQDTSVSINNSTTNITNITSLAELQEEIDTVQSTVATSTRITIVKTQDETIQSDATISNDSVLQIPIVAGLKYHIRLFARGTSSTTADFKWSVGGPAVSFFSMTYDYGNGGISTGTGDTVLADPGELFLATTTGLPFFVSFDATLIATGSGTFAFEWAQNTSQAADTTIYAGSYIEYINF